jgi:hypothetical protein
VPGTFDSYGVGHKIAPWLFGIQTGTPGVAKRWSAKQISHRGGTILA